MGQHLPFVVGRPAGVDLAVADIWLKRRRRPFLKRVRRLDVVVAVDERHRRPGNGGRLGVNDRMAIRFDQVDGEAQLRQMVAKPLGRAADIPLERGVGADAGDSQQCQQIALELPAVVVNMLKRLFKHGGFGVERVRICGPFGQRERNQYNGPTPSALRPSRPSNLAKRRE
jgi:hypothetical protein